MHGLQEPVWGIAYNIAKEDVDRVVAHLDHREKDGYQKIPVTFHPQDSSIQPWQLIIYLVRYCISASLVPYLKLLRRA
ncbi:putative glutathione-specific gamma-glutamylcyclotransferase 2 [Portunus trituberculatus]|uniref:Putative glutathione-specific gamma-glutamylcyclotransferase 2 n=1 Tax=Portunus trituberculatus TaxID=210409 RepID=A0A5B7K7A4_PORTR|nr:putative glutathione-specific gamma-glutamylcyclotransferase 2 [Portunus trituberculatus]